MAEGPEYERIKGWMGLEDYDGNILLTQNPYDRLLPTVNGEPFAVYRKITPLPSD